MESKHYYHTMKLVSTGAHPELAAKIAKHLKLSLVPTDERIFACGELYSRPLKSVRGCDVYVITTATHNVNRDMMELFILLDALRRSFAWLKMISFLCGHAQK